MDWIAIFLAALLAMIIGIVWLGPVFRIVRPFLKDEPPARDHAWLGAVLILISSTMLAASYYWTGHETLQAKPWLYFAQAGGIAAGHVVPAVWMAHYRFGANSRVRFAEAVYYVVAYLAMATVFWSLA